MGFGSYLSSTVAPAAELAVWLYPQDRGLSSPPGYQGGYFEPRLSVVSINQRVGGQVNTAVVRLNLADPYGLAGGGRPEHYQDYVWVDDVVEIYLVGYDVAGQWYYEPLFVGFVANPSLRIEPDTESVEFLIVGFEQRLDDLPVYGQTVRSPLNDVAVFSGLTQETQIGWVGGRAKPNYPYDTIGTDLPLIFNPHGRPNAAWYSGYKLREQLAGNAYDRLVDVRLFEDVDRTGTYVRADYWQLADVVTYLLYCYNDESWVLNPAPAEIYKLLGYTLTANITGDSMVSHLDLSGGRRLFSEILPAVFEKTRYSFTVRPAPVEISGANGAAKRCRLVLFDKFYGTGRTWLHLDPPGRTADQTPYSNVSAAAVTHQTLAAINEVTVAGDYHYHQASWHYDSADLAARDRITDEGSDFVEAWKETTANLAQYFDGNGDFTTDEELAGQFHTRHDWAEDKFLVSPYAGAFRMFGLNERGDYTGGGYNYGVLRTPYDFSGIFEDADFQLRRRRFYKTIELRPGGLNGTFNPRLFVSFDNGALWEQMDSSMYHLAENECKIIITAATLAPDLEHKPPVLYKGFSLAPEDEQRDTDVYWAKSLNEGQLLLKLIACVADDRRVAATMARNLTSISRFTVRRLLIDALGYRSQRLLPGEVNKVMVGGQVEEASGKWAALMAAWQIQEVYQWGFVDGKPVLSGLWPGYEVGQKLSGISGRQISLMADRFAFYAEPTVMGVQWDCEKGRHFTTLELDVARR